MKNKELLNICYKFFNRFINANILIEQLLSIDKTNLSKTDVKQMNILIEDIKKLENDIPNEEDEFVVNKKKSIKRIIDKIEVVPKDDKNMDFINRQLESLKKEYEKEIDSYKRWITIADCINNNEYFNKVFDSLNDYELLEFIAQYINAPFPPQINQDKFDKLVKAGIEKDEREWLWRLAFNYEEKNIKFDSIVNYFIKKKDGYYLVELISAVGKYLNLDEIINKINDKELIEYIKNNRQSMGLNITEEQFNKIVEKLDMK